jgi:hypothetical protein
MESWGSTAGIMLKIRNMGLSNNVEMRILSKISRFLLAGLFLDIIFGFNSGIFDRLLPNLRYAVVILVAIISMVSYQWSLPKKYSLSLLGASGFFCISVIWSILGIYNSNTYLPIVDGKGMALYIFFVLYLPLISRHIKVFDKLVFNLLTALLFFTLVIAVISLFGLVSINTISSLLDNFNITLVSSRSNGGRVWFSTSVLFNLLALLCVFRLRSRNTFLALIAISVATVLIFVSGSRSIIVGTIPLLAAEPIRRIFDLKRGSFLAIPLIFTLVCGVFYYNFQGNIIDGTRFSSNSSEFKLSDDIRSAQRLFLGKEIVQREEIGWGFGHYSREYIRDDNSPFSYENYYLALIMKIGLVGFIIYIASTALIIIPVIISILKTDRFLALIMVIYYAAVFFQAGFNPFLDTILGPVLIIFPLAYARIPPEKRNCR